MRIGFVLLLLLGCGNGGPTPLPTPLPTPSPTPSPTSSPTPSLTLSTVTPNTFYAGGTPTFVLGTLGDDVADRSIAAQVALVQPLFPGSTVVLDTSIDLAAGPAGWPARPVLYGNGSLNAAVAALGDDIPFSIDRDALALGGHRLTAPGTRIIAAVPGAATHPALLVYAGIGSPGVVDINATRHGGDGFLVADAFGVLARGTWPVPAALPLAQRLEWRTLARTAGTIAVRVRFPVMVPAGANDDATADAIARGVAQAAKTLGLTSAAPIEAYVWPDARSKERWTGNVGDGHAVAIASALHVLVFDAAGLERLVAHEATHVLLGLAWGPTASPLIGEGIAVWVAGGYAGVSLDDFASRRGMGPAPSTLIAAPAFRAKPEGETYPIAGLLVRAAVAAVGLANVRDHLWRTNAESWAAACERAGTTAAALDAAVTGP